MENSRALFERARSVMPGGVNSPVRAFRSVNETPRFIKSAAGSRITDADGHTYIDYVCSWGPMLLGHSHPAILDAVRETASRGLSFGAPTGLEVEMAELIRRMVPGLEMVRMVNSGTEAVMSAVRVARGVTGRNKVIKFEGCYHGHSDAMLVKAGSGALTAGQPDSSGVPVSVAGDTITAGFNDLAGVAEILAANRDQVAAVIVEPVAANMGVVLPEAGFLEGLRSLCDQYGSLLIFDEVITGFRLAPGGAQEFYGVEADLVTYGKIIGGGMPVGAYGGRREYMEQVAPTGPVYQAGTLSGNPVAMAAGLAQLRLLCENPDIYSRLNCAGTFLAEALRNIARKKRAGVTVNQVGSLLCLFFAEGPVRRYRDAKASDTGRFARYFQRMLSHHIYLAPSQFEAMFISAAHSDKDLEETIGAAEKSLDW